MILLVTTWSRGRPVTFSTISPSSTKSELEYALEVPGGNNNPLGGDPLGADERRFRKREVRAGYRSSG